MARSVESSTTRRWYRLHFCALAAAVLVIGVLIVANWLPDSEVRWDDSAGSGLVEYRHGWPFTYVLREVDYWSTFPLPGSQPPLVGIWSVLEKRHWSVGEDVVEFRFAPLISNAMVCGLLLVPVLMVVEACRRRRQRFWQLSLRKLLAFMLLCMLATAYFAAEYRGHAAEPRVLTECQRALTRLGDARIIAPRFGLRSVNWSGPKWLDKALTEEAKRNYLAMYFRVTEIDVVGFDIGDDQLDRLYPHLAALGELRKVAIRNTSISRAGMARLQSEFPDVDIHRDGPTHALLDIGSDQLLAAQCPKTQRMAYIESSGNMVIVFDRNGHVEQMAPTAYRIDARALEERWRLVTELRFDDDGDLFITYGDGKTTVMPQKIKPVPRVMPDTALHAMWRFRSDRTSISDRCVHSERTAYIETDGRRIVVLDREGRIELLADPEADIGTLGRVGFNRGGELGWGDGIGYAFGFIDLETNISWCAGRD